MRSCSIRCRPCNSSNCDMATFGGVVELLLAMSTVGADVRVAQSRAPKGKIGAFVYSKLPLLT